MALERIVLSKAERERIKKLESFLRNRNKLSSKSHLGAAVQKYIGKYAQEQMHDPKNKGKYIPYDSRTKKPFDLRVAQEYTIRELTGTDTPVQDYKYLKAKQLQLRREEGSYYNDSIRTKLSKPLLGGGTVYEDEQDKRKVEDRKELLLLRGETSFWRLQNKQNVESLKAGTVERQDKPTTEQSSLMIENYNRIHEIPPDIGKDNVQVNEKEIVNKVNKAAKDQAPAELSWIGPALKEANTTYNKPNRQGELLIARAQDINRAYGVMNDASKQQYLRNPVTQLELEA